MHETDCGCTYCEDLRGKQVKIGCLVVPMVSRRTSPGTTPFWSPGDWRKSGWSKRFRLADEAPLIVMGEVDRIDIDNGGHLDSVYLFSPERKTVVTSRKWLHVISSPKEESCWV